MLLTYDSENKTFIVNLRDNQPHLALHSTDTYVTEWWVFFTPVPSFALNCSHKSIFNHMNMKFQTVNAVFTQMPTTSKAIYLITCSE